MYFMVEKVYHAACVTKMCEMFIPILLEWHEVGKESEEEQHCMPDPAPPRASEWHVSSMQASPVLGPPSPPGSLPHSSSCLGSKRRGHEALFKNCLKRRIRLLGDGARRDPGVVGTVMDRTAMDREGLSQERVRAGFRGWRGGVSPFVLKGFSSI